MESAPKPDAKAKRGEIERVWFIRDVAMDGSSLVGFLARKKVAAGEEFDPADKRVWFAGNVLTIEWLDKRKAKQVRCVPLSNVRAFEPVRE